MQKLSFALYIVASVKTEHITLQFMLSRKALCPKQKDGFCDFSDFSSSFNKSLHVFFSCKIYMISIGRKLHANAKSAQLLQML